MLALVRFSGFRLAAMLAAGVALFGIHCQLHALASGVVLHWNAPIWWGLIAGAPAAGLAFALWHWRDGAGATVPPATVTAAVFGVVLVWGVVARGVIGPGMFPGARELAEQVFVVLPVAAAFAGAAALMDRSARSPKPASSWIELPEEPLLRLRADEVRWISAAGNYCEFHVEGRVHLVRIPLARAAARLEGQGFARAHRSVLVNLASLTSVEPGGATRRTVVRLRCGTALPVGERFRDALLAAIAGNSSHA